MKNPLRSWFIFSAIFAIALAAVLFFASSPAAFAADASEPQLSALSSPVKAAFYTTSEFWSGIIAAVSGLIAIWKNSQASTSAKVNSSLVLAIEEATKIPEVAAFEQRIKHTIRRKAQDAGVQPVLHRIVKNLTAEPHDADES